MQIRHRQFRIIELETCYCLCCRVRGCLPDNFYRSRFPFQPETIELERIALCDCQPWERRGVRVEQSIPQLNSLVLPNSDHSIHIHTEFQCKPCCICGRADVELEKNLVCFPFDG